MTIRSSAYWSHEPGDVRRGLVTVELFNDTESKRVVTSVRPGDRSHEITRAVYMGWSTCRRGCPGAEHATAEGLAFARQTIDGRVPIELAPGEIISLILEVGFDEDADTDVLRDRECIWALKDLRVASRGHGTVRLTGPSGYLAGVKWTGTEEASGLCV